MCINGPQASSPFPLQSTPEHLKLGLCPVTVPSHLSLWYPCPVVCSLECCYFLFWFLLPDRWELIISSSLKCLLLSWVLFLLPWQPDKRNPGRKGVFWHRIGKDIVHRVEEGHSDRNVRTRPGHTGSATRNPRIRNSGSPLHFCINAVEPPKPTKRDCLHLSVCFPISTYLFQMIPRWHGQRFAPMVISNPVKLTLSVATNLLRSGSRWKYLPHSALWYAGKSTMLQTWAVVTI